MSTNPLPKSNPRKRPPSAFGKHGGINWGDKMGAGCWASRDGERDPYVSHRLTTIDTKHSTLIG